jgi:hypothetical protein
MEADRFITFERLRRMQSQTSLAINPAAVARLARLLQSDDRDFRAKTRTNYVLHKAPLDVFPDEFVVRNITQVHGPLLEALSCVAADKAVHEPFATAVRFVDRALESGAREVCVEGAVDLVDPDNVEARLGGRQLSECFGLLPSPDDLAGLDARDVLALGPEEFSRYLLKVAHRLGATTLLPCRLHPRFLESLDTSSIKSNETGLNNLVRRCAEVLAGYAESISGAELRWVRENPNPGSPQRTRGTDGAGAWRITIMKSGAGWRLNFWKVPASRNMPSESIEFAWVQQEPDPVYIPE